MAKTRWQRSRDALAGGVCAGAAEKLGIDAVVARIFAVLLCLMTLGVGAIAYLVLWAYLPLAPERPLPVDVKPREATSETYGAVDIAPGAHRATGLESAGAVDSSADAVRRELYASAGHEPPTPPLAARAAAAAVASSIAAGASPAGSFASTPKASSAAGVPVAPPDASAPRSPADPAAPSSSMGSSLRKRFKALPFLRTIVLWMCFAAAFVGLLRLLGFVIHGSDWWRFWPMFFSLSGIAVMVVPGRRGVRTAHAVSGWFMIVAGTVILPMSVGLVRWASLVPWLASLWPVLVLSVALLAAAWIRRSWPWAFVAGALFTLFCVVGLLLFAEPGSVPFVIVDLPLGRDVVIVYPFR